MMMILSLIEVIKSAGFESDFHYYDVTDLLFMVIPYFSRGSSYVNTAAGRRNRSRLITHKIVVGLGFNTRGSWAG